MPEMALGGEDFVKESLRRKPFTAVYARFIGGPCHFETNSPSVNWYNTDEWC
jgi:hypothetical protein